MSVQTAAPPRVFGVLRRTWLAGTIVLSAGAFIIAIALAPPASASPGRALSWLLFVGSSVHVAATGWFFSVPEIREHARAHKARYILAPIALIMGTALAAAALSPGRFAWALLAFFAWQFFHFQKQNLGMAALAGVSNGVGSVGGLERRGIVLAGLGGIGGMLVHPELLQLTVDAHVRYLFPVAAATFAAGVGTGLYALARCASRPPTFVVVYLISLLFFLPVFCFSSPYAAVAGLTIAHGYQYLLIVGLVAGAPRRERPSTVSLAILLNVALLGGLALNYTSHLHGGPAFERALYGAYLGAVMGHFVIDAGLWRLRDEFPRKFLSESLPYLLGKR